MTCDQAKNACFCLRAKDHPEPHVCDCGGAWGELYVHAWPIRSGYLAGPKEVEEYAGNLDQGLVREQKDLLALQDRLNELDSQIIDTRVRTPPRLYFPTGRVPLWFRLLSPLIRLYWRLTS